MPAAVLDLNNELALLERAVAMADQIKDFSFRKNAELCADYEAVERAINALEQSKGDDRDTPETYKEALNPVQQQIVEIARRIMAGLEEHFQFNAVDPRGRVQSALERIRRNAPETHAKFARTANFLVQSFRTSMGESNDTWVIYRSVCDAYMKLIEVVEEMEVAAVPEIDRRIEEREARMAEERRERQRGFRRGLQDARRRLKVIFAS